MSKVKIQGNASGTGVLTVTAPNTSTDRVITLPDSTGTLLTSDGDGSSLTGVGVAGISSSADATAITINSSEQVGIGIGSPTVPLQVRTALSSVGQSTPETVLLLETTAGTGDMAVGNGTRILFKISDDETNPSVGASIDAVRADGDDSISSTDLVFSTSQNDETLDEALRITNDGRGISHFTARAWARINQTGTQAISMHHNCSSITDNGTGDSTVSFANNIGSTLYCVVTGNAAENEWSERPNPNVTATGSVRLQNVNHSSTFRDSSRVHFAVFMSQEQDINMRLIYKGENGVAAVVTPVTEFLATLTGTDEEKMIHLANKDLPTGTKYEIIGDDVDLSDRTFRNAWTYTAGSDEKTSADLSAEDLAKYNMKENL